MFTRFLLSLVSYSLMAFVGMLMGICEIIRAVSSGWTSLWEGLYDFFESVLERLCIWDKENRQ